MKNKCTLCIVVLVLNFVVIADTLQLNIAVLDVQMNGVPESAALSMTNRIVAELFNTHEFTVLERGQMANILKEQGFQQSGCTTTECAVQIGQLLNVQKIVASSIDHIGSVYSVQLRL